MTATATIAIVSVIVTGIVSPMIAAIATRWQVNSATKVSLAKEYREVLDDGADKLAKLLRAGGHLVGCWSRGPGEGSEESQREFLIRSQAGELMLTAYSRICIRFGDDSQVAQSYDFARSQIDRYLEPFGAYHRGRRIRLMERAP
jgi:hypothetical protein